MRWRHTNTDIHSMRTKENRVYTFTPREKVVGACLWFNLQETGSALGRFLDSRPTDLCRIYLYIYRIVVLTLRPLCCMGHCCPWWTSTVQEEQKTKEKRPAHRDHLIWLEDDDSRIGGQSVRATIRQLARLSPCPAAYKNDIKVGKVGSEIAGVGCYSYSSFIDRDEWWDSVAVDIDWIGGYLDAAVTAMGDRAVNSSVFYFVVGACKKAAQLVD